MNNALERLFGKNYSKLGQIVREGKIYYKAKDACALIGIKNTSLTVNGNLKAGYFGVGRNKVQRVGAERGTPLYISEAGLLMLALRSRKPAAQIIKETISMEEIDQLLDLKITISPPARRERKIEFRKSGNELRRPGVVWRKN